MNKTDSATLAEVMHFADKWLTVASIAKKMAVHPDTIRRWASSGRIKCTRHPINNYRLFLLEDIESGKLNDDER